VSFNENEIELQGIAPKSAQNQEQTRDVFSGKWTEVERDSNREELYRFQYQWFLTLYGFHSEDALRQFLSDKHVIVDTGCGLGYKSAWFARLAPHAFILGIDFSEAVSHAAQTYKEYPNLFFVRADIANTHLKPGSVGFCVCDQVIMHTESPEQTFRHLADITKPGGEFACYVYSKKALPRELIDDYFRKATHSISNEEMWKFSEQVTELGRRLSDLHVSFESPEIPLLGIKAGTYDIQRFIYWNFLKCFWREDWGFALCKSTNYDWFAPSNAKRFSRDEFRVLIRNNNLDTVFFHEEEACYSGRFKKKGG
jgi:SAM-dependent methyltransferase